MSAIRTLERNDLEAVAHLYRQASPMAEKAPSVPGLVGFFERMMLDQPWSDPELPGLVFELPGRGVVGFLASFPRRLTYSDEILRLACSGHLITHPDVRHKGIGALLLRQFLNGPQDLTITDDATDEVRWMWGRLGGSTNSLASIRWTRVLAPATYTSNLLAMRIGREGVRGKEIGLALDRVAGRRARPRTVATTAKPLTPDAMVDMLSSLDRSFSIRAAYDAPFLEWLFADLAKLGRGRRDLVNRLVVDSKGRSLGWYITHMERGTVAQVIQVAAAPDDVGSVLDHLFTEAAQRGVTAVEGRLEPHLYPALYSRNVILRRAEWALIHSRRPEILGTIFGGGGLLTRLEGEWWALPHVMVGDHRPVSTS